MFKKLFLTLSLAGVTFSALAADDATEAVVRKAVLSLAPDISIDRIEPAQLPGFYQVIASGQMVYVSNDGKYLLNGDLLDLANKKSISEKAWADFRKTQLAKVPQSQRIVFAPANPKYHVTVFTDVNCGYCRALHEHIADFNKAGIAVEYVAWPREGVTSTSGQPTATYTEMVSVWCAADPKMAFTEAKQGKAPKAATCNNPVKDEFELGMKLGVTGTPTIVADDGRVVGGYVTPEQLIKALNKKGA
ncbi:thioredoxin fold domain-containing protein [Dyella sp.]|uniref:thioredoxin fold domain-containing protein n=1 Tax=Dyella sp. TaxID=1869338 RepID=UPI002ED690C9